MNKKKMKKCHLEEFNVEEYHIEKGLKSCPFCACDMQAEIKGTEKKGYTLIAFGDHDARCMALNFDPIRFCCTFYKPELAIKAFKECWNRRSGL